MVFSPVLCMLIFILRVYSGVLTCFVHVDIYFTCLFWCSHLFCACLYLFYVFIPVFSSVLCMFIFILRVYSGVLTCFVHVDIYFTCLFWCSHLFCAC